LIISELVNVKMKKGGAKNAVTGSK